MTDKKYTIRPKGKTEPVFEVVGYYPSNSRSVYARLAENVCGNTFSSDYWDIEEAKPTTLDLLNDCGENAYVASRTNSGYYGYVKENKCWYESGPVSIQTDAVALAEAMDKFGLEIIFEGVK